MVYYPLPKFIRKTHMTGARPFTFTAEERAHDLEADEPTCLRCAQSIVRQRQRCNLPEHRRCKHCTDGNRGGCTQVPRGFNGRLNRLYALRDAYDIAVTNANEPRSNDQVRRTGVRLARCQRQFNLELSNHRRIAAHSGTPLGVATQVPTTSPQFLGLLLEEHRQVVNGQRDLGAGIQELIATQRELVAVQTQLLGACLGIMGHMGIMAGVNVVAPNNNVAQGHVVESDEEGGGDAADQQGSQQGGGLPENGEVDINEFVEGPDTDSDDSPPAQAPPATPVRSKGVARAVRGGRSGKGGGSGRKAPPAPAAESEEENDDRGGGRSGGKTPATPSRRTGAASASRGTPSRARKTVKTPAVVVESEPEDECDNDDEDELMEM